MHSYFVLIYSLSFYATLLTIWNLGSKMNWWDFGGQIQEFKLWYDKVLHKCVIRKYLWSGDILYTKKKLKVNFTVCLVGGDKQPVI